MIIKVATDDANAYYEIVSRLKKTHLKFSSVPSGASVGHDGLVLTSRREAPSFAGAVVAIEDLNEEPFIMEGQLLSRLLDQSKRDLLVGIDPGSRVGLAFFYGGRELGSVTTSSVRRVVDLVVAMARDVPHSGLSVKIGGGEPRSSSQLARLLRESLPDSASIEVVNESGTSVGGRGAVGTRDQRAAAKIAFRKGIRVSSGEGARETRG